MKSQTKPNKFPHKKRDAVLQNQRIGQFRCSAPVFAPFARCNKDSSLEIIGPQPLDPPVVTMDCDFLLSLGYSIPLDTRKESQEEKNGRNKEEGKKEEGKKEEEKKEEEKKEEQQHKEKQEESAEEGEKKEERTKK
eukprot:Phypoly_transcript_22533.p1 GENE.Phypoly_transcript_22533~~Phypoly_transcript_22533.p1  ORF type:complete len:136 (+),score=53.04 Phypoly_transcript_22533:91-498(+)